MAVIHRTTVKPTKLELLTSWLPSRPWYGGTAEPKLTKSGGFRLDDPEGEVGIEFMVVTDTSGPRPATYLTPLTYRGAPLDGAHHALVGTAEHGVLGRRWIYDGCHDPVLLTQLLALLEGRVQAQDQNASDTPAPEIARSCTGATLTCTGPTTDDQHCTTLPAPPGTTLCLHRVLRPSQDLPPDVTGHISGPWDLPDATRTRGAFLTLRP